MKILVLDERADEYQNHLAQIENVSYFSHPRELDQAQDCDALLASPGFAAEFLRMGANPRWVQSTWAGVDALLPAIRDSGILLTGIKGIFGQLMSEYVFAYLLADLRDLKHFDSLQSSRTWDDSKLPSSLSGQQITIFGTGSIGRHLAATARHFSMRTTGVNRYGSLVDNFDHVTTDYQAAVTQADYVVACLPDTIQTKQIFNTQLFESMKPDALFMNVGRGSSVDETALSEALNSENLRCAVLDVFSIEPLDANSPLWTTRHLTITPHISAPSFTKNIAEIFLDNLNRFTNNLPLLHMIDPDKGY